ncbi:MAG: hypothetical protein EPO40_28675 [Myxococcaceae bacterium]|nr:MAG: hypothetical protein EPO40_28675 [Myxococcaceae bacterium]
MDILAEAPGVASTIADNEAAEVPVADARQTSTATPPPSTATLPPPAATPSSPYLSGLFRTARRLLSIAA